MNIRINLSQLLNGMELTGEEIDRRIAQATKDACIALRDEAEQRVPKGEHIPSADEDDKGPIRESLKYRLDRGGIGEITGTVGSEALYAAFYHEGTGLYARKGDGRKRVPWHYRDGLGNWHTSSGNEPHPFLEEAADAMRDQIAEIFRARLRGGQ